MIISPEKNRDVVEFLAKQPRRSVLGMRVWALLLVFVDPITFDIPMFDDDIARFLDQNPDQVSLVMSTLEGFGVISRKRIRVAGMEGLGRVSSSLTLDSIL